MGYYSYVAEKDSLTPIEHNCYVGLCSLSGDDETALDVIMDVGGVIKIHKHKSHDEFVFVISGEVKETITETVMRTGQSMSIKKGALHGFSTENGCKMKVVFKPKMT